MSEDRLLDDAALVRWTKRPTPLDWGGMLLRPGMRGFNPRDISLAGAMPGIYLLGDADDRMLYIGKAGCLNMRLRQHRDAARFRGGLHFDFFCCLSVPAWAVRDVEIAHIHALEPPANRLYEPAYWRGHVAMVSALRAIWRDA
jgi:hypothetical protein